MYKPFANAHIYVIWHNGIQYGGFVYSWKAAKKRADALCNDLFEKNQIEILDVETGEITTIQKGVKQQVTPSIVAPI